MLGIQPCHLVSCIRCNDYYLHYDQRFLGCQLETASGTIPHDLVITAPVSTNTVLALSPGPPLRFLLGLNRHVSLLMRACLRSQRSSRLLLVAIGKTAQNARSCWKTGIPRLLADCLNGSTRATTRALLQQRHHNST